MCQSAGAAASLTAHLTGYFRVVADSLDDAKSMLAGNPLYEAGQLRYASCPARINLWPSDRVATSFRLWPRPR